MSAARRVLWVWGPALAHMAAIFAVSAIPNLTPPLGISDHTGHVVEYALLGLLLVRAFASARWSGLTAGAAGNAWIGSALYGASDEFHQRFVHGRVAAFDDWVADAIGAAAGIAGALVWRLATGRRESREV